MQLLHNWDPVLLANGSALPLGMLMAYSKVYKDGFLKDYFDFQPLVNRYPDEWHYYADEAAENPASIWLISSYIWNHKDCISIASAIKQASPTSLIIAGGPHIPGYEAENKAFLINNPFIDITSRGEGEVTLAELLETIAAEKTLRADFSRVSGVTFRAGNGELIRTADRVRTKDINIFPSPYLTGEFDHESFNDLPLMILETNRGCPFGCTFCDWGSATLQKFSLYDFDRVKNEISVIVKKRTGSIYLGDSNFGAFERDLEITKLIAEHKRNSGFPKEFGTSFAKNASQRLADITKILKQSRLARIGLISIQTTDADTLSAINRSNIRNDKYEKLIEIFRAEKINLSSELLIGLPGQTVESHKDDLQFFIDRKLMTIAYCTAVMPNAPMNDPDYRKKYKIVTNSEGYIVSTSTFDEAEHGEMITLFLAFQFFYGIGVLKYYLFYLQMEYKVRFMDFVYEMLCACCEDEVKYPISYLLKRRLLTTKRYWSPSLEWNSEEGEFLFNNLDAYYSEILEFTQEKYGITIKPTVSNTLITAQKAVMPTAGKVIPFEVGLEHDLCAYMHQLDAVRVLDTTPANFKMLDTFPPAKMKVSALKSKTIDSVALAKFDRHTGAGFELKSPLRFHH